MSTLQTHKQTNKDSVITASIDLLRTFSSIKCDVMRGHLGN